MPSRLLNRWRIQTFNEAWFRKSPHRRRDEVQSLSRFFHPLDGVTDWNRLYGPSGFLQWQCVVPFGAEEALRQVAESLAHHRVPTLIGVLKRFGPANPGPLSFPLAGWTLSVDVPATVEGLAGILDGLDEVVAAAGGRLYLAKDSRMRPELLAATYPRLGRVAGGPRPGRPQGRHPERPGPPPRPLLSRRARSDGPRRVRS